MLEREEGRELKAYPDPLTHGAPWTIGIGHCGPDVRIGTVWTNEQVDEAFARDVARATTECTRRIVNFDQLNEARQAVLIGMCFQMGLQRLLGFTQTLHAVSDGRYEDAANGMRASNWAHQTPLRALRMADQMESGQWFLNSRTANE